jgi:hypothetical protein
MSVFIPSAVHVECHYVKCCYAECHYAECVHADDDYADCHFAGCHFYTVSLFFCFFPSDVMMIEITLRVLFHMIVMLTVALLSVVMLNVITASVIAPEKFLTLFCNDGGVL